MLFSVPLGTSLPGFPATVTLPRLTGCLYCRWLPSCTNNRHPSFSSMVITSLNFMTRNCARTATGLTANCLRHDMRHSEIDLSAYGVTAKRFRTKWVFHPYRGNGDLKGIYPVTSRGRARFSGAQLSIRDKRDRLSRSCRISRVDQWGSRYRKRSASANSLTRREGEPD